MTNPPAEPGAMPEVPAFVVEYLQRTEQFGHRLSSISLSGAEFHELLDAFFESQSQLAHLRAEGAKERAEFGAQPRSHAKSVCTEIIKERVRQQAIGWMPDHDDTHTDNELTNGAIAKCVAAISDELRAALWWPWPIDKRNPFNGTPRQLRIEALAMIVADVERMDRTDAARQTNASPEGV